MPVLAHRAVHDSSPLARRAWLALALVPFGWVASLAVALIVEPELSGDTSTARGVVVGLVALAAPAWAVICSDVADRGERSGRTARALSAALFFLTMVALPRVLVSVPAFVIALTLCLVALSVGLVLARRRAARR
jgi:hypothetical protein